MNAKFALVTGGAKRLGAILCQILIENGYNLIIHYNKSEPEAYNLREELQLLNYNAQILLYKADFTKDTEVANLIKFIELHFKKLNLFINNASLFYKTSLDSIQPNDIDIFQKIHINSPLSLLKWMIVDNSAQEKTIINILDRRRDSRVENIQNYGEYFLYSLSKHCQYLLHQYIKKEIESRNKNCKIFGLFLNMVLPNLSDQEFYLKKGLSNENSQRKIKSLCDKIACIVQDSRLLSQDFEI